MNTGCPDGTSPNAHAPLLGSVNTSSNQDASLAVLIVVIGVIIFELILSYLHSTTKDTPFQDMASAIQKELMVVGSMAFVFKIITSSTSIDSNLAYALEYADMLIPITSFCYCGTGLFLIMMSVHQTRIWHQGYTMHLIEIFDEYYDMMKDPKSSILKDLRLQSMMEFRVFHMLFCKHYNLAKGAFPFDDYVHRVFERLLLSIVTIRPVDWAIVTILSFLGWAVDATSIYSCNDDDMECLRNNRTYLFLFFGALILFFTLFLAFISRRYEQKILRNNGLKSSDMYPLYLRFTEDIAIQKNVMTYSTNDLKVAINSNKTQIVTSKMSKRDSVRIQSLQLKVKEMSARRDSKNIKKPLPQRKGVSKGEIAHESPTREDGQMGEESPYDRGHTHLNPVSLVSDNETGLPVPVNNHNRSSEIPPIISGYGGDDSNSAPAKVQKAVVVSMLGNNRRASAEAAVRAKMAADIAATHLNEDENADRIGLDRDAYFPDGTDGEATIRTFSIVRDSIKLQEDEDISISTMRQDLLNSGNNKLEIKVESESVSVDKRIDDADDELSEASNDKPGSEAESEEEEESESDSDEEEGRDLVTTGDIPSADLSDLRPELLALRQDADQKTKNPGEASARGSKKGLSFRAGPSGKPAPLVSAKSGRSETTRVRRMGLGAGQIVRAVNYVDPIQFDYGEHFSNVFLFGKPEIYFESVMLLIMVISFYISLWITKYVAISKQMSSGPFWQVLTLAPGVLSVVAFLYVVRCAALLKALCFLDGVVIEEIIEEMEGSALLMNLVRDKILLALKEKGDKPEDELKELFSEIGVSGSQTVSRTDIQIFLSGMNIVFTRKRWQLIFKQLDKDFDDKISFSELFMFVFPDSEVAKKEERTRLKIVKNRVRRNAREYDQRLQRLKKSNSYLIDLDVISKEKKNIDWFVHLDDMEVTSYSPEKMNDFSKG